MKSWPMLVFVAVVAFFAGRQTAPNQSLVMRIPPPKICVVENGVEHRVVDMMPIPNDPLHIR